MKKSRRGLEIFSLSFIDCICCGFGALILLFVLSKFGAPVVMEEIREDLEGKILRLEQTESPESVSLRLEERGVPHEVVERRMRYERDRIVSYPALRFVAGRQTVDAVVFPLDGIRLAPCSPVDGKPMRRASAAEVEALL